MSIIKTHFLIFCLSAPFLIYQDSKYYQQHAATNIVDRTLSMYRVDEYGLMNQEHQADLTLPIPSLSDTQAAAKELWEEAKNSLIHFGETATNSISIAPQAAQQIRAPESASALSALQVLQPSGEAKSLLTRQADTIAQPAPSLPIAATNNAPIAVPSADMQQTSRTRHSTPLPQPSSPMRRSSTPTPLMNRLSSPSPSPRTIRRSSTDHQLMRPLSPPPIPDPSNQLQSSTPSLSPSVALPLIHSPQANRSPHQKTNAIDVTSLTNIPSPTKKQMQTGIKNIIEQNMNLQQIEEHKQKKKIKTEIKNQINQFVNDKIEAHENAEIDEKLIEKDDGCIKSMNKKMRKIGKFIYKHLPRTKPQYDNIMTNQSELSAKIAAIIQGVKNKFSLQ